ncbi:MAG: homoserine dehydrogenase [Candidatus Fluviicola riflensis]|nr:MAG: homoserine dehydrogenase [Candidatus Fluviicola riflensis]OGS79328.1 MAG: homoserine dehydrogenase [Candidatus Fluviicola riflensis]OGS86760.1 MAG: homoserine dehydrogenase [Fluviicola sp. RIFCSPHIGHO2_01_FULL_43_53]OGS88766.1 MAG: homoserine dehydrogenase [Fluviicola sp. RIFCSPHIGHO2_12_FULL_43_24]
MSKQLTIGLFGFGCVGTGLYEVLNQTSLLQARIKHIVVKDATKKRQIDASHFSYDAEVILNDSEVNVVVELINDSDAAYVIVKRALESGKHVVSANKKLIALHLEELIALAKANNVSFLYEAAVGGSIPIIRNLEEYYNNDSLSSINGIVNGTTNYILTKTGEGQSFDDALKTAQELGFAELDPTSDVDGFDAKYKLVLLLKHAFGYTAKTEEVWNYGIRQLKAWDATYAREKGYKIKLLAFGTRVDDQVVGFVAPHLIPANHFAFNVENEFNAVVVEALFSDRQLFLGKGAGSYPTASAVLSDISALQFDYAYEYRKTNVQENLHLTTDFRLRVYISGTTKEQLNRVKFEEIQEIYHGSTHHFHIGWVHFNDLQQFDWNNEPDLFLAVLPEGLELGAGAYAEEVELEAHAN